MVWRGFTFAGWRARATVCSDMNVERCLSAAEGYLQLEMPSDAIEEIAKLPSRVRRDIHASELELAAEMMLKHWNRGSDLAQELCDKRPTKKSYFLHAAYCLHETGDTLAAKKFLMAGPKSLLQDGLFHYNMGCYSAVLGNNEEARRYVLASFKLDPELRNTAESDPDLANIDFS